MPDTNRCRPYRALIWKEWREQRWKLAYNCVLLFGVAAIGFRSHMCEDVGIIALLLIIGGLFLPLLAAVGVVGTERESGSLPFLQAQPVSSSRVLSIKMVGALLVSTVPLALTMLASAACIDGRDWRTGETLRIGAVAVWLAANVVVWTIAFGMTQPTEGRVGMVGIAVIVAWFFHLTLDSVLSRSWIWLSQMLTGLNPLKAMGLVLRHVDDLPGLPYRIWFVGSLAIGLLLIFLLWAWSCRRFRQMGRVAQ